MSPARRPTSDHATSAVATVEPRVADAEGPAVGSTRTTGRRAVLDAAVAAAVELARHAALAAARDVEPVAASHGVGEHLEVFPEGDRVATHLFVCTLRGYLGWRWAVTLVRASRAKTVTVSEVVLLPGPDSLLAPEWLPWSERLAPGDLGVGDVMATEPDDERLVPGYCAVTRTAEGTGDATDTPEAKVTSAELDVDEEPELVGILAYELGLGRARVLSPIGHELAATRWYEGEHGPGAPIAQAAPAQCVTCGFLVPLRGSFASVFGVCSNEWSPSDGRVVSYDHGCGAHSEAAVASGAAPIAEHVVDTAGFDPILDDDRDF